MADTSKPRSGRRGIKTRKHGLLAVLLILLTILAWSHRDRLVLVPDSVESMARVAQPSSPSQVYFGPPYSVAALPLDCRRYPLTEAPVESAGEAPPDQAGSDGPEPVLVFGLAATVLDTLVAVPGLQVTAADSSFFFAGSTESPRVLAERLKVRHLLDGCVRRTADNVRLEVGLYDVRAGTHSWTRQLDASVQTLRESLHGVSVGVAEEVRSGSGTEVPAFEAISADAWLKLLEGRLHARQPEPGSLDRARLAFEAALEIQPGLAPAWLGLAEVYLQPAWQPSGDQPGYEQARHAAEMALELDPTLAGAHVVLSRIERIHDWNFMRADRAARLAMDLLPGSADVLENAGAVEFVFGRFRVAIDRLQRAIDRNPVVLNKLFRLGLAYEFAGEYDQALVIYRQLLGLNPDYPGAYAFRARVKLIQEKPESALREAEQEQQPFWRRYARILALDALGRSEESGPLLAAMVEENGHNAAFQLAEIQAMRGDADRAFEWLERAHEQHDGGMSEILGNPFLNSLHADDRWSALVQRMGLDR